MTYATVASTRAPQPPVWQDALDEDNPFTRDSVVSPGDEWNPEDRAAADPTTIVPVATAELVEGVQSSPPTSPSTAGRRTRASAAMAWCNPADAWRNRDMSPSSVRRRKWICWGFAFACVCVAIGLLAASLKKVPSTEMGVQYDIHKKQLEDASKSGGLFVGPPGFRFIKFPSTFITVDVNDRTCVSNDGLLVKFSVTFQYQMTAANVLPAIENYRDYHKWASTVEQAGLSAIHHSCSEFSITEFQNKRGTIQQKMFDNLKLKLEGDESNGDEGVNAVAVSLQLAYLELPAEYKTAVEEKQKAEEDIALAIAQRKQETTKANTNLLKAKEEARKIKDTANNEAEVLLTEARLKAEETLFTFQKEAEALREVREKLNLTTEGVLAYLSNRLLAEADNLKVTTGEPAKLSRKDEL